ncbi:MAG: ATPase [Clostridiales bacterium]|jgi:vacuolar-type H+-ATPase subunit H|nr:ATPase [Clostridiales bacterium]
MDSLLDYLDMLEELLENSKSAPFSSKISVDKEQIFDILGEIRMNLPVEMRQAQRIIEDHDKIIAEAKSKADDIIKESAVIAQEKADEHEVYKIAVEQSREVVDEAKKTSRDMRMSAVEYADEILSKTENAVRDAMENLVRHSREIEDSFSETIDVLYSNRQELRGNKG